VYWKSSEFWLRPNTYPFLNINVHILCLPPLYTSNLLLDDTQSFTELPFAAATIITPALSINGNKMDLVLL